MRAEETEFEQEWDAVIVGTGMGGATLGHSLAKSGWRVLFVERGESHLLPEEGIRGDYAEMSYSSSAASVESQSDVLRHAGRRTEYLEDRSGRRTKKYIPFIGMGTGGSSALYGAVMERFFAEDFSPGQFYAGAPGVDVPDAWPLTYEELSPYYREAETLYRVRGTPDPLRPDQADAALLAPKPLSPANRELFDLLGGKGLHPYQLPMACEFVPGCLGCQAFLCDKDCKNDSVRVCLSPALEEHGASMLDRCEVKRLHADNGRVTAIDCDWRGRKIQLRAKLVILAAGALATPEILLRSTSPEWPQGLANSSGMVGRNLMRHCIDLYALYPKRRPQDQEHVKEIAFNDYYVHQGRKFGSVQSFGRLPPSKVLADEIQDQIRLGPLPGLAGAFGLIKPLVRPLLDRMLKDSLLIVTTLEDLPRDSNRVYPLPQGGIAIEYRLDASTVERIKEFRALMARMLSPMKFRLLKQAENNERIAHACGTCRMGVNARTSVLDPHNRAHGLDNLYVVDASFFPSSGGINPSLTIAANALRVARHLVQNGS